MSRFLSSVAIATALVYSLASCQQIQPAEIHVQSLSLSNSSIELTVGDQFLLDVSITPENATNKKVTWSSSKESVATISSDGVIEAISAGTAYVFAASEDSGVKAKCEVTIIDKTIKVTGIALDRVSLALTEGEETTLIPTITPENATNKSVTWSSSNETVATVSDAGLVKALRAGSAVITATTNDGGKTASCAVSVDIAMGAVTGAATHITCRGAEIAGKANIPSTTTSTDLAFGVLYSASSEVLLDSATQIEAKSFDSDYNYSIHTEVLEPETTYYYRSYISQSGEITYGDTKSFNTLNVGSMIQCLGATYISYHYATLSASLDLTDCIYDNIEYGFEITPAEGDAYKVTSNGLSSKKYSLKIDNLLKATKYSYKAYVTLDGRTYNSKKCTFETGKAPLDLNDASDIAEFSATISGALNYRGVYEWCYLYYSCSASTLSALNSGGTKIQLTLASDGSFSEQLSELDYGTQYYYAVVGIVATEDKREYESEVKSFTTKSLLDSELVDLGLSVKWRSWNLGATKPEEYGDYYAWAATEPWYESGYALESQQTHWKSGKSDGYHWKNTPYQTVNTKSSSDTKFTKYLGSTTSSYKDDSATDTDALKTVLDMEDDAARVNLGGKWRMPTNAECSELMNTRNCSWTWTTVNGVNGYVVQSKKSGYTDKLIFLPAAGMRQGTSLTFPGSYGSYWSSSLYPDIPDCVFSIGLSNKSFGYGGATRCCGGSVRPVSE